MNTTRRRIQKARRRAERLAYAAAHKPLMFVCDDACYGRCGSATYVIKVACSDVGRLTASAASEQQSIDLLCAAIAVRSERRATMVTTNTSMGF